MNVHILADSACDLPLSFFKEENVTLIPLGVELNGQNYEDLVGIQPKEVYAAIKEGQTPKTSQASPLKMKEIFTELAKSGTPSLYVAFSSELSGTYQTSVMVANEVKEEYPGFKLSIIDSKGASMGYGLAVVKASELAKKGTPLPELEQAISAFCQNIEHLFTVDDLDFLAKGGRVSKASAFLGGLLNIKPLLDVENGKLIPREKIRGKKKVYRRIIELMNERGNGISTQTVAISHGDAEETAQEVKAMIEEAFQPKQVLINTIGAAVGSHSGPGTIAVFFSSEAETE
ncbi:DegV family protein [Metabacillus sp. GX 13764]|uniref:DegV family protein n=1 Tax=Metabacillus kandeliae TaxID=2900151 RepID=UPI001E3F0536|nr:DegV family protein [Metabacillus kandeliae]MCD7034940.1 DegV family protein [Metabacillus kandeliae]